MAKSEQQTVRRQYSTADDHVTVYSDQINVMSTGGEVILSVYQTIPSYPDAEPPVALSSRRATVILNPVHAANLGRLLLKHSERSVDGDDDAKGGS